ncbi:Arc family DNA-binding protein [Acinetobacter venetianus]|uniref:Arc family DNA-binding protein n=1 Tax=Acinetobacter venetianus TaxID=52133 RepID=UPI002898D4A1|nr:Arc family DNA-binding protein [Acinetobacter venetianus]
MADIQFNLRIPEELKVKIKEAAAENGRSINAEAQMRLEQSFTDKNIAEEEIVALTAQVRQLIDRIEGGKL